jgi:hypothetical protein
MKDPYTVCQVVLCIYILTSRTAETIVMPFIQIVLYNGALSNCN